MKENSSSLDTICGNSYRHIEFKLLHFDIMNSVDFIIGVLVCPFTYKDIVRLIFYIDTNALISHIDALKPQYFIKSIFQIKVRYFASHNLLKNIITEWLK